MLNEEVRIVNVGNRFARDLFAYWSQATGYKLQAASGRLRVIGYAL